MDSDLSVSDVSWSDSNRHLLLSGQSTTNRTMQLKEKCRTRAQKKYDKMVEIRKSQSETILSIYYTGKNHVQFFIQLEFRMKHLKDLKYFKIHSAKPQKNSIHSHQSTYPK